MVIRKYNQRFRFNEKYKVENDGKLLSLCIMSHNGFTKKDLDELRRYSLKLRLAVVGTTCFIIAAMWLLFKYYAEVKEQHRQEEIARFEEDSRRIQSEIAEHDRLIRLERERQLYVAESIKIANMPIYTIAEVHELVKSKTPSYSWKYLWRKDNDNWIVCYMREYGGKQHWFMRRFNPTIREFDREIEVIPQQIVSRDLSNIDRQKYCVKEKPQNYFIEDIFGNLRYHENGYLTERWSRIKQGYNIPSTSRPPSVKNRITRYDDYEDFDDYYYDNEEDMRFFYGR